MYTKHITGCLELGGVGMGLEGGVTKGYKNTFGENRYIC